LKNRLAGEQIAFALKQVETGTSVVEVPRRVGIFEQTELTHPGHFKLDFGHSRGVAQRIRAPNRTV
jgi:hypothetical protein